jgi:hypothetical protein
MLRILRESVRVTEILRICLERQSLWTWKWTGDRSVIITTADFVHDKLAELTTDMPYNAKEWLPSSTVQHPQALA